MKLYYARHTRSVRPRWLLEELGVPYEIQHLDLARRENQAEAYLGIHPLGLVPALVEEEGPLFESVALCLHLADRFPERGLAPPPGTHQRGLYYQWMLYGATNLDSALVEIYACRKHHPEDPAWQARARVAAERLDAQLAVVEQALQGREYLLGGFSAADVVVGSLVLWAGGMGLLGSRPGIQAYASRLKVRPAWKRATAD